jgi:hypothetical protein
MTSVWDTRAKGLFVEDKNGVIAPEQLDGMDFLIAKTGELFTKQIQSAYDCKPRIPFIMFYENDPEPYLEMGLDPRKWPVGDADPQIKYLDRMIGNPKRSIHGIMLSCSKIFHQGTKAFSPAWITQHGQHMLNMIWNRYHIPMYLYMDSNPWAVWKDDVDGITMLNNFVKTQISTVTFAIEMAGIVPATGQAPKLPADTAKWYFWLYSVGKNCLRFLYNGNKAMLYDELNFVAPTTPEVPPTEEIPPATNVDLSALLEMTNKNNILLNEISSDIKAIKAVFANL